MSSKRNRYDALPPELKAICQDFLLHTNASLRAAVKEYFADKAACERRHGKMNTWDVGRVTDMSRLFYRRFNFNEDISAWDTPAAEWKCTAWTSFLDARRFIGAWDTFGGRLEVQ